MSKYTHNISYNSTTASYSVSETYTNNVVKITNGYQTALDTVRFLEAGGGFKGYTPTFLTLSFLNKDKK